MDRMVWLLATASEGNSSINLSSPAMPDAFAVKGLFRKTGVRFETTRLLLRVAMPTFRP